MRPAAALNICTTGGWQARGYLYGRNYGPVHERDYIFSFSKLFDVSGKFLQGSTGLSLSAEDTTIKFSDNPEDNAHYTGTNIGIDFGLNATFFTLGSLNIKGTWDSQLYPAGSAAIFLANGRKQALGLLAVVQF